MRGLSTAAQCLAQATGPPPPDPGMPVVGKGASLGRQILSAVALKALSLGMMDQAAIVVWATVASQYIAPAPTACERVR